MTAFTVTIGGSVESTLQIVKRVIREASQPGGLFSRRTRRKAARMRRSANRSIRTLWLRGVR